jgi:hypothetical protein
MHSIPTKNFIGKSERKRSLGRPRHKWENNIKMDTKEIRCGVNSTGSG